MNCKPNDVCVIKKPGRLYGKIIKVTCLDGQPGLPHWEYEGTLIDLLGSRYTSIRDEVLRPLGDPSQDARDETLSWAPVPLPVVDPSMLEGK